MRNFVGGVLLLCAVATLNVEAQGSYRRRVGHAAISVEDKLIVNGGLVCYTAGIAQYENVTYLLDLSVDWDNSTLVPTIAARPDSYSVMEYETLWLDNATNYVYSYGGQKTVDGNMTKGSDIAIPEESIWRFQLDNSGAGNWYPVLGPTASKAYPSGLGGQIAGATAAGNGKAYYLGGALWHSSTLEVNYTSLHNVPGLIEFGFTTLNLENSTNDGGYFASTWTTDADFGIRQAGHMTYVPSFGSNGVFVIAGGQFLHDISGNIVTDDSAWSTVTVLDPVTGSWYNQSTTGDIPTAQVFAISDREAGAWCVFGAQDGDSGTYEIFFHGPFQGVDRDTQGYTFYILSLPSFTWFASNLHVYPPRQAQTCTMAPNNQMIMIGGFDQAQPAPMYPDNWNSSPDPWEQGIGVFDMTELKIKDGYNSSADAYSSPGVVAQYLNTSSRYPTSWGSPAVQNIFQTLNTNDTNSSTTASSSTPSGTTNTTTTPAGDSETSNGLSGGVIAGIVVGSIAGVALIAGVILWILRDKIKAWRGRGKRPEPAVDTDTVDQPEQNSTHRPARMADQRKEPAELPDREKGELPDRLPHHGIAELPNTVHRYELNGEAGN